VPVGSPTRWRDAWPSWLGVLGCALLSRATFAAAARYADVDPFGAEAWIRWDSEHYLSIAERGYAVTETPEGLVYGNAGWFPGYSWLVGLLGATGLGARRAAVCLSFACFVGTLLVLWQRFLGPRFTLRGVLCLLLAAFFPGSIYYHAAFPISLVTLLVVLLLAWLPAERWRAAALAGGGAAVSYSTGFLLAPVTTLWALVFHGSALLRLRKLAVLLPPLGVCMGLALALAAQDLATGRLGTFFQVHQSMQLTRFGSPLETLRIKTLDQLKPDWLRELWSWETFALRAANGRLVGIHWVEGQRELDATHTFAYPQNAFRTTPLPDGRVSLTADHHHVLSAGPGREHPILVPFGSVGPAERLAEVPLARGEVAYRTARGAYLGLDEASRVVARAKTVGASERFTKEPARDFFSRFRSPVLAAQTLVVCLSLVLAVALVAFRRAAPARLHVLILLYALFFFVFPLAAGREVAQFRAEALLLPLVVPLRQAPAVLLAPLLLLHVALAFPLAVMFFQTTLS
jgi:hypothetical protein